MITPFEMLPMPGQGGSSAPGVKGDKGDPGLPGATPTNAQLTALITPLIPAPVKGDPGLDGEDGDDGVTPTNAQLTALITPLIPAPVKGDKGDQGTPGAAPTNAQLTALITPLISAPVKGDKGDQGTPGAAPTNSQLTALITPLIPAPVKGDKGDPGAKGADGDDGEGLVPGFPVDKAIVFGTAYQAPDPTRNARISVMIQTTYNVTIAGNLTDEVEIRVGPTNAVAAGGTGTFQAESTQQSLIGIAVMIGTQLGNRAVIRADIPPGAWFSVRRLSGTTSTIHSCKIVPLT
jgi:hypothetical protein